MSKIGFLKNKVFSNSLWLILERVLSMLGLIFVTSMVAKYIGPDNYGKLVFANSLFAVIQIVSMFGSENLFFQKISKNKIIGEKLIFITKGYRTYIYLMLSAFLLIYLYFYTDRITFIYSIATFFAMYFALHDMPHTIYFDALLKSKINVLCNILGLIFTLVFRYIIVVFNLDIVWLIIPIFTITFIPYVSRLYLYSKIKDSNIKLSNPKLYRRYMLGAGRKLFLYSLAVIIYTRTAQIILGIESQFDLGIYTAAITIGTSFSFVLNAIITSSSTRIYAEKNIDKSQNMISLVYAVIIILSLFAIAFLYFLSPYIVDFLYGKSYEKVNDILIIISISCLLANIANASDKYLIKLSAYQYLSLKNNILVFINIFMSAILIHFYGLKGAVISLLIIEFISATISNYFFKSGVVFKIQINTFSPLTYIKYFK